MNDHREFLFLRSHASKTKAKTTKSLGPKELFFLPSFMSSIVSRAVIVITVFITTVIIYLLE